MMPFLAGAAGRLGLGKRMYDLRSRMRRYGQGLKDEYTKAKARTTAELLGIDGAARGRAAYDSMRAGAGRMYGQARAGAGRMYGRARAGAASAGTAAMEGIRKYGKRGLLYGGTAAVGGAAVMAAVNHLSDTEREELEMEYQDALNAGEFQGSFADFVEENYLPLEYRAGQHNEMLKEMGAV